MCFWNTLNIISIFQCVGASWITFLAHLLTFTIHQVILRYIRYAMARVISFVGTLRLICSPLAEFIQLVLFLVNCIHEFTNTLNVTIGHFRNHWISLLIFFSKFSKLDVIIQWFFFSSFCLRRKTTWWLSPH